MAKKYPNTVYANAVKNKLSYYIFAKQRLSNSGADSLSGSGVNDTAAVNPLAGKRNSDQDKLNGEKKTESAQSSDRQIEERNNEEALRENTAANPDTLIRVLRRFQRK